jgi:hypothetical protein
MNNEPSSQPKPLASTTWELIGANLAGPEATNNVISALRRNEVSHAGPYQIYSDFSAPHETVVFVHAVTEGARHKYIVAITAEQRYIVAAPMQWFFSHRDILGIVRAASEQTPMCVGGGFVAISERGNIICSGESGEFGRGDHSHAKAALERAVKSSAKS